MRLVTSLYLIGRNLPIRPTLLPLVLNRGASRLSAINQGLRRSERAQGSKTKEIRRHPSEEEYLSPAERRRARTEARRSPVTYKIRKGKKDITEEPGPPRKSRAARFADPRDPLGRKSLVKKFKTGQLLEEVKQYGGRGEHMQHDDFARQMMVAEVEDHLKPRRERAEPRHAGRVRPSDRRERVRTSPTLPRKHDGDVFDEFGQRIPSGGSRHLPEQRIPSSGSRHPPEQRMPSGGSRHLPQQRIPSSGSRHPPEQRMPSGGSRHLPQQRIPSSGSRHPPKQRMPSGGSRHLPEQRIPSGGSRYPPEQRMPSGGPRHPPEYDQKSGLTSHRGRTKFVDEKSDKKEYAEMTSHELDEVKEWKPKKYEPPVSITYTTAASQFLYGTSTVEAALKASRRKLYTLYIYKGSNRRNREKDRELALLANERRVKIKYVDENGLSMLSKMSGSRPHNGYVLEASPLPQLPIRALGDLSGEESRPGFRVVIGHQSREEAQINGTSEFVPTEPSPYKPLVLVLDQVLDPGNLGAILRTASFMGVTAVAVSKRGSAPVTPVVLKASAGAAETLPMFSVESVADLLNESKENGWKVYAAMPPQRGSTHSQVDTQDVEGSDPLLKDACVLVVGSEGEGLSRSIRRAADYQISIPNLSGSDAVESLNVGVATALLCSAFLRGKSRALSSGVQDPGSLF